METKNKAQLASLVLMILCTVFTSLGQILWKFGVIKVDFASPLTLFNLPFIFGFVSYGAGAALMILAFQRGEMSLVYPLAATSFVWVSLISPLLFPTDSMNAWKWTGVFLIITSVSVLGWGCSKKQEVPHG